MSTTSRWPSARRGGLSGWAFAGAAALFALVAALPPAGAAPGPSVAVGSWVTYHLGGRDRYCGRVTAIASGADGRPWAWVEDRASPVRVFRLPVDELSEGCG